MRLLLLTGSAFVLAFILPTPTASPRNDEIEDGTFNRLSEYEWRSIKELCGRQFYPKFSTGTFKSVPYNFKIYVPPGEDEQKAKKGQFPWMVQIFTRKRSRRSSMCGGALISPRHVLTAAHCLFKKTGRSVP